MLLSVITGTYQRLLYLRNMMASVKASLPPNFAVGVEYEFCICDGGSTDGTLEWLRNLSGVKLIEHGGLKGAIAAFNDAAKVATGDYLLIANDDVIFDGVSVSKALAFIMDHADVGCACMYQDRGGQDLHVETIPVYKGAATQPERVPYMQVGIIPRWLWESVGGWGDGSWGSKTYGGDTYLSMRVIERGYKVEAVPGATIHDLTPDDALRQANYKAERESLGPGGKGVGFWKMFPIITENSTPFGHFFEAPLITRKRVLYAPIIEDGHSTQKKQKRGLRDALWAAGAVWEADYMYSKHDVAAAAEAWNPHLTVTQFHTEDAITKEDVGRIKRATQKHMINWCGDVWADQQLTPNFMDLLRLYDYHLVVNATLLPRYAELGIRASYWQNSFEGAVVSDAVGPECDIIFLGNNYSPKEGEGSEAQDYRLKLARALKSLPYNVKIIGRSYPPGLSDGESLYDYAKTGALYRGAKIIIADNQYLNATGFASDRIFMALASGGGMLMHQRVEGMEKYMGFHNGIHYIEWDGLDDLRENIDKYMANSEDRVKIARAGTLECRNHHTYADRVTELGRLLSTIPERKQSISGMMIVRNEEERIETRLKELEQFCDDIVIVDTGSTDNTRALALAHQGRIKPRLFDFAWVDDFSAARNLAKSKCAGDWIFWMDADDFLPENTIADLKIFQDWGAHETKYPGAIKMWCVGKLARVMQVRLFKNLHCLEWGPETNSKLSGRFNETLEAAILRNGITVIAYNSLSIIHKGSGNHFERNIRMLDQEPECWEREFYKAQAYAAKGDFAMAFLFMDGVRRGWEKEDARIDYIRHLAGLFLFRCGFNDRARDYFDSNPYPDSIFYFGNLEKDPDKKADIFRTFLKTEYPTETITQYHDLIGIAEDWLRQYYTDRLKELND